MSAPVVRLVPPPSKPRTDRAATALAAMMILVNGGVQIAQIAAYCVILLLAAVGAVSLLGR